MRGAVKKFSVGGAEAVQFPLRAGGMPHGSRQHTHRARGGERRARGAMPVACDPAGMAPILILGFRRVALPGVAPLNPPPVHRAVPPVFAFPVSRRTGGGPRGGCPHHTHSRAAVGFEFTVLPSDHRDARVVFCRTPQKARPSGCKQGRGSMSQIGEMDMVGAGVGQKRAMGEQKARTPQIGGER